MTIYKFLPAVLSIIITLYLPARLAAEDSKALQLDYSNAIKKMLDSNELLQSVKFEKQKSEYEKNAAFSLFLPKVDLMFSYTHLNDPIEMDFNPLRDAMIELSGSAYAAATTGTSSGAAFDAYKQGFITNANANPDLARDNFIQTIQDQNFWVLNATVKQPIFTGGKIIAANKAAAANLEASSEKVRYTQYALMTELAQRYYGARLLANVVAVRKDVLDGMKDHLDEAKKMQESGMIPNAERLHAEVAFSEAEREFKKSLRDSDTAIAALKNTISLNKSIEPVSELFVSDNVQDMEYYKKKAYEMNPMLSQLKAYNKMAEQAHMKELANYSPDIFVFGSYNIKDSKLSPYAPEWFVGAAATLNIFDGFKDYNEIKASSATKHKVEETIKKAFRDIDTLVEKNYNELMKDYEQLQTLQKSLEFAEEYLRVRDTAFKAGFATSIDVVDAQLNLSKVKVERLQALYEFDVSLARLLEVCGLSEQFDNYRKEGKTESQIIIK